MNRQLKPGKWRCPGVFVPIEIDNCPNCGEEVEFFPGDVKLECLRCGRLVYRQSTSCLERCPAKQSSCYREMLALDKKADKSGKI